MSDVLIALTYDFSRRQEPVVGVDLDEVRPLYLHAVLRQGVQVPLNPTRTVHCCGFFTFVAFSTERPQFQKVKFKRRRLNFSEIECFSAISSKC